jgi:hypothetical protein
LAGCAFALAALLRTADLKKSVAGGGRAWQACGVISDMAPYSLNWDEVDPSRHPFDRLLAVQVVDSLGPALRVPRRPDDADPDRFAWGSGGEGQLWADAMSYALVQRYGRWATGWRWAHGEGDFDGGPVGSWCCPRHSITTPEETLARVVAALCEWRGWLENLAGWFEEYPLELSSIEAQRIQWEQGARNLILQVVDRTGGASGWYWHCNQVLTWFLSRWHVEPDVAQDLVDQAIGGRFHSWTFPDTELVGEIAERLALSLRPDNGSRPSEPTPDHLQRWLAVRESVPWHQATADGAKVPVTPSRDGAALDIRAFDGAVDPARAKGMLAALELVRADAARGASLSFTLLRSWQQHVLGTSQPPPFRNSPAFAKGGRERYGIDPSTRVRFDACLAETAQGSARPPALAARAARAYLDVCFFHPFDDGNARAAFLTTIFLLAREGVTLNEVSVLRRVTFQADNPEDPLMLARFIDSGITQSRRTAASSDRASN